MLSTLKSTYWNLSARRKLKKDLKCAERKQQLLGQHAQAIVYNSQNGLIAMPPSDMTIGRELAEHGHWDIEEVELLRSKLESDDHLYVVGTHVGTLLVPLSKGCQSVVGYEANPSTFQFLQQNVLLNQIGNARIFNLAAGDKAAKIEFLQSVHNSGGSKIKPAHVNAMYLRDNPNMIEVEMVSMTEHIAQEELPAPTAMIMDIEGAEYAALRGLGDKIAGLRLLYIEFVPHHLRDVANIDLEAFLSLLLPHFSHVQMVRSGFSFDLEQQLPNFTATIQKVYEAGASDDLLFQQL